MSSWIAFTSLLLRNAQADSPLFTVAVDILLHTARGGDGEAKRSAAYRRTRSRLWLALMLSKYPTLRPMRKGAGRAGARRLAPVDLSFSRGGES